ncbi:universal stress protein [Nonomuraea turcica]|uniref:universal stress protein n=1 Tax=Nonomuraea sp. G32 TaxID=3067274 RepID=UPI00273C93EC|nr:universal stress protein [Nonomuraea sp. G32]MDP4508891.1 universal stress protein [Nonomuraea sp. G32]
MNRVIVVGTDGSAAATAAVEWAAGPPRAEARLRIVHAVDRSPYEIAKFSNAGPGDAVALSAESVLADAEAVARKRQPCIEVAGELFQGSAAAVLRTHAGKSRRDRHRARRLSRRRTSPRLRFRAGDTPREHTTRRLHVATTGACPHPRKRP